MIMSLGVFYSTFLAPHELTSDSPLPPMDRFKLFRAAAAWCLVWGKYTQPSIGTIPPFILYVEAEFIISRAAQMNCYLLSSVCLRLLLKMGLHREPSKLTNISAFEGEMRRRMWNMAVQMDLLVSFHMGLPSMLNGIDSDVDLPRNLVDEDFDEHTPELPPPRPLTDYTEMTYPITKSSLMRVFGQVARQAHLLAPPPYAEVIRLDGLLNDTWRAVPQFMMVKPLEQCVTTPAMQVIQRFGLASLYNKSRCVLHRRFLLEPVPKREHDYSRWQCLEGAMTLLEFQNTIWHACRPGNMLAQNGWFVSSLAVHDFLLAAIILYLAVGHEQFWQEGGEFLPEWMDRMSPSPTKEHLLHLLQRSYSVWVSIAADVPEIKKTADVLETMLGKLGSPPSSLPKEDGVRQPASVQRSEGTGTSGTLSSREAQLLTNLSLSGMDFLDFFTRRVPSIKWLTSCDRRGIVSFKRHEPGDQSLPAPELCQPGLGIERLCCARPWMDRGWQRNGLGKSSSSKGRRPPGDSFLTWNSATLITSWAKPTTIPSATSTRPRRRRGSTEDRSPTTLTSRLPGLGTRTWDNKVEGSEERPMPFSTMSYKGLHIFTATHHMPLPGRARQLMELNLPPTRVSSACTHTFSSKQEPGRDRYMGLRLRELLLSSGPGENNSLAGWRSTRWGPFESLNTRYRCPQRRWARGGKSLTTRPAAGIPK